MQCLLAEKRTNGLTMSLKCEFMTAISYNGKGLEGHLSMNLLF